MKNYNHLYGEITQYGEKIKVKWYKKGRNDFHEHLYCYYGGYYIIKLKNGSLVSVMKII